jgi:hypothetical protein
MPSVDTAALNAQETSTTDDRSLSVTFIESQEEEYKPEETWHEQVITLNDLEKAGDKAIINATAPTHVGKVIKDYTKDYGTDPSRALDPIITVCIFDDAVDIRNSRKFAVVTLDPDVQNQAHLFIVVTTAALAEDVAKVLFADEESSSSCLLVVLGERFSNVSGKWLVDLQLLLGEWLFSE